MVIGILLLAGPEGLGPFGTTRANAQNGAEAQGGDGRPASVGGESAGEDAPKSGERQSFFHWMIRASGPIGRGDRC